jgi:hypothetical protein
MYFVRQTNQFLLDVHIGYRWNLPIKTKDCKRTYKKTSETNSN